MSGDGGDTPAPYLLSLFPAEPEPAQHAPAELEAIWGRRSGASTEVGRLRRLLVRRPGHEWDAVRADTWDERARALVDPARRWYWTSPERPDVERMRAQHDAFCDLVRREGVEVVDIGETPPDLVHTVFVRDTAMMTPGGAVVARLAPRMRRGEERYVSEALVRAGVPILRTLAGSALMEGGSFAKLTPAVSVCGTSIRCNDEGARQLGEALRPLGVDLLVVPLGGWSIHIDAHLSLVDFDKAIVDIPGLPYWFLDRLRELGIEAIPGHPDEGWAINALALAPGRVIMSEGSPRTIERLEARGVEVQTVQFDEIQKGGGGIHCSTLELSRDDP